MSFSSNVKRELSHHFGNARHCNIAEIAAIINMCGFIAVNKEKICVKIQTENVLVAKIYFTLLKKTFNIYSEITVRKTRHLKKKRMYIVFLTNEDDIYRILFSTGIMYKEDNNQIIIKNDLYSIVVNSICCKRSYIRSAFLASGSLTDPEKNYHMEFVCSKYDYSLKLKNLINSFGIDSKIIKRKENFVIYLKDGNQIVDLLNIMQAHVALMELENVRILKDMRNNVNRIVNCETANLNKTVAASIKQTSDILYIKDNMDISKLSKPLFDLANLRLSYQDASLKELGEMMIPPVSKSGVNHRLRKISKIAKTLREENGDL